MPSPPDSRTEGPQTFYGNLAGGYDRMVDFANRLATAEAFVKRLCKRFCSSPPSIGVDLGCGTGAYTLALAAHGLQAAGVDISPAMLTVARQHARDLGLEAVFVQAGLQTLPDELPRGESDLVLCLGNTVPHLTDPDDLLRAFTNMRNLLATGAVCVVQTLNYDNILKKKDRIVSVDRQDDLEFVRFYDFLDNGLLRFNILQVQWEGSTPQHAPLDSVLLNPYTRHELEDAAEAAGLTVLDRCDGLGLEAFEADSADTLLLVTSRS